jgi:hypothetical protein
MSIFKPKKEQTFLYAPLNDIPGFNPLTPVKTTVPDWYRKHPQLYEGTNKNILPLKKTVKHCVPFLDALTTGYVLTTLVDISVAQIEGVPLLTWKAVALDSLSVVDVRDTGSVPTEFIPYGHSPIEFVWWTNIALKVPKGYAMLCTHPLNRYDLPFLTGNAVVAGNFPMQNGQFPFFVREGFEGIIPKGTPFMQIIPFKEEKWNSEKSGTLLQESIENNHLANSRVTSHYKDTFWTKKQFN